MRNFDIDILTVKVVDKLNVFAVVNNFVDFRHSAVVVVGGVSVPF
jgi:hypothetical protein